MLPSLILSPLMGTPGVAGVMQHFGPREGRAAVAITFVGEPLDSTGYVADVPPCGPLLIFSPAITRGGPPRREGLASGSGHSVGDGVYIEHDRASKIFPMCVSPPLPLIT